MLDVQFLEIIFDVTIASLKNLPVLKILGYVFFQQRLLNSD